jgi:hypothetical protein
LAPGDKVKCVLKVCYLSEIKIRLLAYMWIKIVREINYDILKNNKSDI